MQIKINCQKVSRYLKSHYWADLNGLLAPEESLKLENQFPVLHRLRHDLSSDKTLQLA